MDNNENPKNKEKKKKNSIETIKKNFNNYVNHKFKYPKGQFCLFYFKGTCSLNNKCQFAHGMTDFSFENYLKLINDPEAIKTELQKYWQHYNFYQLFKEYHLYPYDNLVEYQKTHKELFPKEYSLDEIRNNRNIRNIIRMPMGKEIISEFLKILFEHFPNITIDDFNKYLLYVGYPYSLKDLIKEHHDIFFTKTIDKKMVLIKFEKPNIILEKYIKILTNEFNKKKKFEDIFPMSYKSLTTMINKNIGDYIPNVNQYMNLIGINEKEFVNKISIECIKECEKGNLNILKGKNKDELFIFLDVNSLIDSSIKEIYDKHFNENKTSFAYIYFNFIEKCYSKKLQHEIKHYEKAIFYKGILFQLFKEKALMFLDNSKIMNIFNYNKFKNFDVNNFYDSYYFKKCPDKDINDNNKMNNLIKNFENLSLNNIEFPKENIYNIQNTEIKFVNNEKSLMYFFQKSKNFKVISIDIEGDLSSNNPTINLIQICDNSNNTSEIFVIDIYTFTHPLNENVIYIIKNIFENKNIKKIFFDGRNDLISLHFQLNICIQNYIDLSPLYSAVKSFNDLLKFESNNINDFKNLLNNFESKYIFQGLNTVLYEYHPLHCINELKTKYHTLFHTSPLSKWIQRPILEEFLYYSVLDVKYEYETYMNLRNDLKKIIEQFYNINELNENTLDLIILLISCGHLRFACDKYKTFISNNQISNK